MKKVRLLPSVLLVIFLSTTVVFAEEWLPLEMEPPKEFDIVVTLDIGPLVTDIPVYPGTTTISLSWTVYEEWWTRYHIVNLVPQANGYYNITVWSDVTNPSNKWAYALHIPYVDADPYGMVNKDTFKRYYSFPPSCLWPYAIRWPWSSTCKDAVGVRIIAEVVDSGKFKIYEFGNQLRTDINKDGIVNIKDLYLVAIHYGESYPEDAFKEWDILLDHQITYEDLISIAVEFGRTIPP